MNSPTDLINLGKTVSREFITRHTPLTEGLEKVAREHDLNANQIQRVAETANVETYLSLIKIANDKYLNFDLADTKKVTDGLLKKTANYDNVTEDIDKYTLPNDKEFNLEINWEKTAEYKFVDPQIIQRYECAKLAHIANEVTDQFDTEFVNMHKQFSTCNNMIKQAVLSGTAMNELEFLVKQASSKYGDLFIENFKDYLKHTVTKPYLEKVAEVIYPVNEKSKLFNSIKELSEYFDKLGSLAVASQHYTNEYNEYSKENKISGMIKESGLGRMFKKFPRLTTAAIITPLAYFLGKSNGKKQAERMPALNAYSAYQAIHGGGLA